MAERGGSIEKQMSFEDLAKGIYDDQDSAEYTEFVEKFKPRRTTDDCFTPPNIYATVLDYCVEKYGIATEDVVRPFYPGGDYERHDYPDGCVVIDNPPFSIVSKIAKFYVERGVRFFLFAPYLTNFNITAKNVTHVIAACDVTYENGARVGTAFITNMEPGVYARSEPELTQRLERAEEKNATKRKRKRHRYRYPDHLLTAAMLGYMAAHQTALVIREGEGVFVNALDSQRAAGKTIYGGGYLLTEKAAAEKAAAEKAAAEKAAAETWELSERERKIIARLLKNDSVIVDDG